MGRPKSTWKDIIDKIGDMTPTELVDYLDDPIGGLAARFRRLDEDHATIKELVVITAFDALLTEPVPSLLEMFINRVEGKVKDTVDHNVRSVIVMDRNAPPVPRLEPPSQE